MNRSRSGTFASIPAPLIVALALVFGAGALSAQSGATLEVITNQGWLHPSGIDKTLAEQFTKESGINVDFQVIPQDQYVSLLKVKLAAGEGADVFYYGVADLKKFNPDKNMADLSGEAWTKDLRDWARKATTFNGKVVSLNTWGRDGWGMLYDSELFAKYKLKAPTTWDEFVKVADTLQKNGVTPIYEPGKAQWHIGQYIQLFGAGVEKQHPGTLAKLNDGSAKLADDKDFVTAVTRFKDLSKYFQKDYMSADFNEGTAPAMASGKYGMLMVWTAFSNDIAKASGTDSASKWLMFPVPINPDMKTWTMSVGGINRAIVKGTKNLEAAKKYFAFLARKENVAAYYKANTTLLETSFKTVETTTPAALKSVTAIATDGIGPELSDAVQYVDSQVAGKAMQEMLFGDKTPLQVLQAIDADRAKMFKANQ
jgi:raffinose/stachyose/melibiose transport system substrate-binding protein